MSDANVGRLRYEHDEIQLHAELYAVGKAARAEFPRRRQGVLTLDPDRDPLGILEQQHHPRLPDLIPLRVHRMLQSPFAFYRGSAALRVADLADEPTTGFDVVLCGDAHIANF